MCRILVSTTNPAFSLQPFIDRGRKVLGISCKCAPSRPQVYHFTNIFRRIRRPKFYTYVSSLLTSSIKMTMAWTHDLNGYTAATTERQLFSNTATSHRVHRTKRKNAPFHGKFVIVIVTAAVIQDHSFPTKTPGECFCESNATEEGFDTYSSAFSHVNSPQIRHR